MKRPLSQFRAALQLAGFDIPYGVDKRMSDNILRHHVKDESPNHHLWFSTADHMYSEDMTDDQRSALEEVLATYGMVPTKNENIVGVGVAVAVVERDFCNALDLER